MTTVLAALAAGPAAQTVLDVAVDIAGLLDARVEAVHVGDRLDPSLQALSASVIVPLQVHEGADVPDAIIAAASDPEVGAVVLGARTLPGGGRPRARTARRVVETVGTPAVVVPPDLRAGRGPIRRLLVPVEDRPGPASALGALLPRLRRDVQVDVVPGARLAAAGNHEAADLVVLGWAPHDTGDHAALVHEVLGTSRVPVLLMPIEWADRRGARGRTALPASRAPRAPCA
jgi:nucleotide-binding universal stress UspA family protein